MLWMGYSFYFMDPTCGQWIEQENDGKWYVMDRLDEKQKVFDGPFNSELQAEKSISICVSNFNKRRSKYGTIYNLLPFENPQNIAESFINIILSIVFLFGPPYLLFKYFYFQNKSKKIDAELTEEEVKETIKSLDKALDHLDKLKTSDESNLVDFSVREEDFKVEPIKTLFKLSKELPEKEYHKKAVDIWKKYIIKEYDGYGKKSNVSKKDLYYLTLENWRDDYGRIDLLIKVLHYQDIAEGVYPENYAGVLEVFGLQIAYADDLIFLTNSDIWGEPEVDNIDGMETLTEIGWDYDDSNPEDSYKSYENMKKAFFSFDQLCEYLAKCKIYDYKEALEAGALGEDIDFRHFDISKMEK